MLTAVQVSKLSGAAAAAEVQQSSATSALKDNKALLKALQKKLAQHDKQEGQHKPQVEEGTKQLWQLQAAAADVQERLAAARTAADAAVGAISTGAGGDETAEQQRQQQMLQQKVSELERDLQLLTARKAAAAAKATRAAKSVEGLQQKAAAAATAAAEGDRALEDAQQEVQAAAVAAEGSRQRSMVAEEQWRAAELQQQLLMVSSILQDAVIRPLQPALVCN